MTPYIAELADAIRAEVDPARVPVRREVGSLFRVYAVLALAKGERVSTADVHDAWAAWKYDHDPEHRALVPFEELAPDVQRLDEPYARAIRRAAQARRLPPRARAGRRRGRPPARPSPMMDWCGASPASSTWTWTRSTRRWSSCTSRA